MGKKKEVAPTEPQRQVLRESYGSPGDPGVPEAYAGYQQFARTGGFSPEDLANIRARSISPVRAVYSNAQREVNRQRALQGGYSPGFQALQARMAREQSQGAADAYTDVEANIAEMVQKGKLAGLEGMIAASPRAGGGGGAEYGYQEPEKKKGFWSKFGGALKKVGQVALPIALNYMAPGTGTVAKKLMEPKLTSGLGGMVPGRNIGIG
jgi:hypothetical protein